MSVPTDEPADDHATRPPKRVVTPPPASAPDPVAVRAPDELVLREQRYRRAGDQPLAPPILDALGRPVRMVWRYTCERPRRPVAVKFVRRGTAGAAVHERVGADRVANVPGLAVLLDYDDVVIDNTPWTVIVSALVEGEPLDHLEQALEFPQLAAFARRLADTLAALGGRGLVHCDLKPANVVLTPEGHPVVVDPGSVRRVGEPVHSLTRVFAPPEAADAAVEVVASERWDAWGAGLVICHAAAPGQSARGRDAALAALDLYASRVAPQHRVAAERLVGVVAELLECDPEARLNPVLLQVALDAASRPPASATLRRSPRHRRRRFVVAAGAAALLAAGGGAGALLLGDDGNTSGAQTPASSTLAEAGASAPSDVTAGAPTAATTTEPQTPPGTTLQAAAESTPQGSDPAPQPAPTTTEAPKEETTPDDTPDEPLVVAPTASAKAKTAVTVRALPGRVASTESRVLLSARVWAASRPTGGCAFQRAVGTGAWREVAQRLVNRRARCAARVRVGGTPGARVRFRVRFLPIGDFRPSVSLERRTVVNRPPPPRPTATPTRTATPTPTPTYTPPAGSSPSPSPPSGGGSNGGGGGGSPDPPPATLG